MHHFRFQQSCTVQTCILNSLSFSFPFQTQMRLHCEGRFRLFQILMFHLQYRKVWHLLPNIQPPNTDFSQTGLLGNPAVRLCKDLLKAQKHIRSWITWMLVQSVNLATSRVNTIHRVWIQMTQTQYSNDFNSYPSHHRLSKCTHRYW